MRMVKTNHVEPLAAGGPIAFRNVSGVMRNRLCRESSRSLSAPAVVDLELRGGHAPEQESAAFVRERRLAVGADGIDVGCASQKVQDPVSSQNRSLR